MFKVSDPAIRASSLGKRNYRTYLRFQPTVLFLGLLAIVSAIPVDYKPDEIPVQVVLAESVPAPKEAVKALPVEAKEKVEVDSKSVEADVKPAEEDLPTKAVLVLDTKTEDVAQHLVLDAAPLPKADVAELKSDPETVMVLVEVPATAAVSELAPAPASPEDSAATPAEPKEADKPAAAPAEPKEADKSAVAAAAVEKPAEKDLDTEASSWGGWAPAAPVVSAWPVATTYHSSWAPAPSTYYYQPTPTYSHSYWPSTYSHPRVYGGWW